MQYREYITSLRRKAIKSAFLSTNEMEEIDICKPSSDFANPYLKMQTLFLKMQTLK